MSFPRCLALPLFFALTATAAEKPSAEGDMKKMQGTWAVASLTTNGKRVPADALKNAHFIVTTNKYRYRGDENYEGTFTLVPSSKPRGIDSTFLETEGASTKATGVARGIYKFEGGRLIFCWSQAGSETRPKEFSSEPKSGNRLMILEKAKGK